ncbi:thioredoxin [Thraustotheca clavata]|uniref:Sulfhydryl oxidase n=1 Tax=Thraustotheca clavata TaxID=74557 RepID=A0A1V9Y8U9_9STRA|nr:thioredoxin [Thraustotheca clavata]
MCTIQWLLMLAMALAVQGTGVYTGKDKDLPLFNQSHPNITFLTDDNFNELVVKGNGKPWLMDFYHPYCPHCRQFVPVFEEIAAYYKPLGIVNVGALSCMHYYQCSVYGVKGFPTLLLWNFDKKQNGENKRAVGEHTMDEVLGMVADQFRIQVYNETGSWPPEGKTNPPTSPAATTLKPLWEESTLPSNVTTRVIDSASAFVFGLKSSIFVGKQILDDAELDALKEWIRVVSLTFPGSTYRLIIRSLYDALLPISLLTEGKWTKMVSDWQAASIITFQAVPMTNSNNEVEEWMNLPWLFEGEGTNYVACELYTCGQWTLFHIMTMLNGQDLTAPHIPELAVAVIGAARRFVRHYLTCIPCREHFLKANTVDTMRLLDREAPENKARALYLWLWKVHNGVNRRIRHYQWPKPTICANCTSNYTNEDAWDMPKVEKWLKESYGFEEPYSPPKTQRRPITTAPQDQHEPEIPAEKLSFKQTELKAAHHQQNDLNGPDMSLLWWYLLPVAVIAVYMLNQRRRRC